MRAHNIYEQFDHVYRCLNKAGIPIDAAMLVHNIDCGLKLTINIKVRKEINKIKSEIWAEGSLFIDVDGKSRAITFIKSGKEQITRYYFGDEDFMSDVDKWESQSIFHTIKYL